MESVHLPQEGALLPADDRAVFQRVWQRVTETGGGESPIEALPPAEPAVVVAGTGEAGRRGRACGELRGALASALESAAAYAALARRLGNRPGGRQLQGLSAAARRRSKRLAVACFLLDGVWYLPQSPGGERREGTVMGGLRERYLAERRSEEGCRSAAARAEDGDLAGLWLELAAESRENAQTVRRLLEEL